MIHCIFTHQSTGKLIIEYKGSNNERKMKPAKPISQQCSRNAFLDPICISLFGCHFMYVLFRSEGLMLKLGLLFNWILHFIVFTHNTIGVCLWVFLYIKTILVELKYSYMWVAFDNLIDFRDILFWLMRDIFHIVYSGQLMGYLRHILFWIIKWLSCTYYFLSN